MPSTTEPDKIIVLLHGIRTQAHWAEMVANVLETELGVRVQPIKYGFFDVIRFLFPFWTRREPVRKIIQEYRDLRLRYPQASISVIAHSFGTYALTKALEEPDLVFDRVIFCGSIAPESFRVTRYRAQLGRDPILNDCGTHDILPVLAKSSSWGYGATGTFGFGAVGIRDRFSKFSHSTYFKREFVRDYWAPFLRDGTIIGTDWEIDPKRTAPPYWQSLIAAIPVRWIAVLAPLGILGVIANMAAGDEARVRLENAYVSHYVGLSQLYLRFAFENKSLYNTTFTIDRMDLAAPGESYKLLNLEGITNCNGSVPTDLRIFVEAGRTSYCEYSFLTAPWGMQELYKQLEKHFASQNLFNTLPDPTKVVLDGALLEQVKTTASQRFEWRPGEWRLKVQYRALDQTGAAEYTFPINDAVVASLKKLIDHYPTGFGVFPPWRYFTPTGQQPMQQITIRKSTDPS